MLVGVTIVILGTSYCVKNVQQSDHGEPAETPLWSFTLSRSQGNPTKSKKILERSCMNKIILTICLVVAANFSNAGAYTGKSEVSWISSIYGDYFVVSGSWSNVLSCSTMQEGIWKIYSENNSMEDLQSMYSMALAAYMAGKTIELYAHRCGTDGRPNARSIYLPSRSGN